MKQVRVVIEAVDAITQAGLVRYLQSHGMTAASEAPQAKADVVVLAINRLDRHAVSSLRQIATTIGAPVVLLVNQINENELLGAVEYNVTAVLPRAAAADDRLARHVRDATEGGMVGRDLLGHLMEHVRRLQREILDKNNTGTSKLSGRETDVLRLMADGWGTDEIARKLCYSERTVKNVISAITSQLHVRNRPHAVACAMRAGMI